MRTGAKLPINEATIKRLHRLCRGEIWDAGAYKEKDVDIIQTYADGHRRVRFKTVSAPENSGRDVRNDSRFGSGAYRKNGPHRLVLAAALNLDFLCIHPFRDGNGRVSRLLFLLACYHCGLEVGRYVSLERPDRTEQGTILRSLGTKFRGGGTRANTMPWLAMNFLLFILAQACKEFEQRVGQVKSPRGEKTAMVLAAIDRQAGAFSVSDLQNECPGVGVDLVRKVLKQLRGSKVVCLGRGQTAKWKKSGK